MEITERLDNIEKLLNEAKTKIDRALADCPPFLKTQNRPALSFYHANAKGTGCAAIFQIQPADKTEDGHLNLSLAPQMTVGSATNFPRFDFANAISVKLDFDDIAKMLQVFRGECESVNGEHGLYHRKTDGSYKIQLRHLIDPVSGYSLEIHHAPAGESDERKANILMSNSESLGLCEAIAGAMYLIAFGR